MTKMVKEVCVEWESGHMDDIGSGRESAHKASQSAVSLVRIRQQ